MDHSLAREMDLRIGPIRREAERHEAGPISEVKGMSTEITLQTTSGSSHPC